MSDFRYPFFKGFKPQAFLLKSFGFYAAALTGSATLAEWSPEVAALKAYVLATPYLVFEIGGVYVAGLFSFELLKLKVKRDLARIRWERESAAKRGRSRNRR